MRRLEDHELKRRRKGTGSLTRRGYVVIGAGGGINLEHRIVAERALGHALPAGAVVHHIDGNPSNNLPSNLVICPNQAYHKLLHQRQDAINSCGKVTWRKCAFCKEYDDPEHLYYDDGRAWHRECANSARRIQRRKR
jgi:hypothetical protein